MPMISIIYGLSKINKEGTPLRPIMDTIDPPMILREPKLEKFLVNKLNPLIGNIDSFI